MIRLVLYFAAASSLLTGLWVDIAATGEPCRKLAAPVTGEDRKYAVNADVYGPVAFADIGCAVYWRSKHFCAMEISSFEATARVADYYTGAEVAMISAFFVVDAPGLARVKAFATKEDAERFAAGAGGGSIVDFRKLTE